MPIFDNSRPYVDIPFQFSLHIQKEKGGECEHVEFLAKEKTDPRPELIEKMLGALGKSGSIIAYTGFELRNINNLIKDFPQYTEGLSALKNRIWDMSLPFKKKHYNYFQFMGRYSIKVVLPVLVPSLSYEDLEVNDGGIASIIAQNFFDGKMCQEEWDSKREGLLKYCGLDTWGMVELLKKLYEVVE